MTDTASDRDHAWLEGVFRLHHQAVLAYARRRVPFDEADDVVGEVFASTWKYRDRVPDPALPWLYRTASHHVLHVHRGAGRRDGLAVRLAQANSFGVVDDHAEAVATALDDGAQVRAALLRLTPSDVEILRLDAWEQLDNDALAYVLGCTRTAARVRLHRARKRFANVLDAAAGPAAVTSLAADRSGAPADWAFPDSASVASPASQRSASPANRAVPLSGTAHLTSSTRAPIEELR